MKIIALRGGSDSGKTSILKKLMAELLKDNELIYSHFKIETICQMTDPKNEKWFTKNNKKNISNLTITLRYKEKIVTITSIGDSTELIVNSFEGAKRGVKKKNNRDEIDIYVCACHPKMNLSKTFGCNVFYVDKNRYEKDKMNDNALVNSLVSELNKLI